VALTASLKGCEKSIYLVWNNYKGFSPVKKYEIYRSVSGGAEGLLANVSGSSITFKDSNLSYHNNYCYRILAYDNGGANVSSSNRICKQVFFVDTPNVVVATKLNSLINGQVQIKWTSQRAKPHLAYYRLYYSNSGKKPFILLKDSIPLSQTSFIHSGVNTKVNDQYYYLQTIDSCGSLSEISKVHKTMTLIFHVGQLVHKLNWTSYKGWPVKYYIVQHGTGLALTNEDTMSGGRYFIPQISCPLLSKTGLQDSSSRI